MASALQLMRVRVSSRVQTSGTQNGGTEGRTRTMWYQGRGEQDCLCLCTKHSLQDCL